MFMWQPAIVGQTQISLSGVVLDEESDEPLAFVMLRIEGTSIGTVSNEVGRFDFKYPEKYQQKNLIFSHIGYHDDTLSLPVQASKLVIRLKPRPIALEEVTIRPKPMDAQELMKEAMARVEENYPTDPFILHAFFRDIKLEEEKCVFLLEAATRVYDDNYHKAPKVLRGLLERVAIDELRYSYNYIGKKEWKATLGKENAIKELLGNNFIRYQYGVFNLENDYEYVYEGEEMLGNQLLYIISVPAFPQTKVYINAETFGVVKFSYQAQHATLLEQVSDSTQRFVISQNIQFEFQPYQEKLYLKYITSNTSYEERYIDSGIVLHKATLKLSMMVNKIETGDVKKIKGRIAMNKYKNLEEQASPYNEQFWKNYNMLQENPLDSALIRDLEKELSLKEQFPEH